MKKNKFEDTKGVIRSTIKSFTSLFFLNFSSNYLFAKGERHYIHKAELVFYLSEQKHQLITRYMWIITKSISTISMVVLPVLWYMYDFVK
jgi:hypothetical protein